MIKTVDNTNLGYLISKIKAAFWPKADVVQIGLDNSPTQNSDNLVKSGGVYDAVAAKYTKPANGIPASDLESGVIPTVPTISTNITTDAASTTKTAAPKAVVDYVPTVAAMLASGMSGIKIWVGTQADYNLLTPANDTLYFIKSS